MVAERMNRRLQEVRMPAFREADNKRVSMRDGKMKRGPMGGWDAMRQRIVGENGKPMIYCFSTCGASIRTIPVLQPRSGQGGRPGHHGRGSRGGRLALWLHE